MKSLVACLGVLMCLSAVAKLQDLMINGGFSVSEPRYLHVVSDLLEPLRKDLGKDARVEERANAGGEILPALVLQPVYHRAHGASELGTTVTLPKIAIPRPTEPTQFKSEARIMLLFDIGILGNSIERPTVQFGIDVGGRLVFNETLKNSGWQARAVDLTPWAGDTLTLRFHALVPKASRGMSVGFARPLLVDLWGPCQSYPGGLAGTLGGGSGLPDSLADGSVLALYKVECFTRATVRMALTGESWAKDDSKVWQGFELDPGTHWIPLYSRGAGYSTHRVDSGVAGIQQLDLVPYNWAAAPGESLSKPEER